MITDTEILNAQQLIANAITVYKFQHSDEKCLDGKIIVKADDVILEGMIDELVVFKHKNWHCFLSADESRLNRMADYLKSDKMGIQFKGRYGKLAYIMAIPENEITH